MQDVNYPYIVEQLKAENTTLKQQQQNQSKVIEGFQKGLIELFGLDKDSVAFFDDFKRQYQQLSQAPNGRYEFGEWVLIDGKTEGQVIDNNHECGSYTIDVNGMWEKYSSDRITKKQAPNGWVKLKGNINNELPDENVWLLDFKGEVKFSAKSEYVPFNTYSHYCLVVPPTPPKEDIKLETKEPPSQTKEAKD